MELLCNYRRFSLRRRGVLLSPNSVRPPPRPSCPRPSPHCGNGGIPSPTITRIRIGTVNRLNPLPLRIPTPRTGIFSEYLDFFERSAYLSSWFGLFLGLGVVISPPGTNKETRIFQAWQRMNNSLLRLEEQNKEQLMKIDSVKGAVLDEVKELKQHTHLGDMRAAEAASSSDQDKVIWFLLGAICVYVCTKSSS